VTTAPQTRPTVDFGIVDFDDFDRDRFGRVDPAQRLAAAPDGFTRLWSPLRRAYYDSDRPRSEDDCVFCAAPTLADEHALIVHRGRFGYVLLNLYPYNSGHLLVVPYRHFGLYDEATVEEAVEIAQMTQTAMRVVRLTSSADGFNIGMNQGSIAGAGIAAHLHQHLVPRWATDTNFLPVVAQARVIPRLLGEVWEELVAAWPSVIGVETDGARVTMVPR
jgi:ATP adenylyltransferase